MRNLAPPCQSFSLTAFAYLRISYYYALGTPCSPRIFVRYDTLTLFLLYGPSCYPRFFFLYSFRLLAYSQMTFHLRRATIRQVHLL